ncbi:MAG TPA: hypothetical protein DEB39_04200 [Planctomycetaceae bacterium]|nr:hypothetical protein [Planctomycetaceae bacterium]
MWIIRKGELTIRKGRLACDIIIEAGATLRNEAEIHAHTLVSNGEIRGRGTIRTHVTSKPIGGVVDPLQIIVYWPKEAATKFALPVWHGNLFSIPKQTGRGELT